MVPRCKSASSRTPERSRYAPSSCSGKARMWSIILLLHSDLEESQSANCGLLRDIRLPVFKFQEFSRARPPFHHFGLESSVLLQRPAAWQTAPLTLTFPTLTGLFKFLALHSQMISPLDLKLLRASGTSTVSVMACRPLLMPTSHLLRHAPNTRHFSFKFFFF